MRRGTSSRTPNGSLKITRATPSCGRTRTTYHPNYCDRLPVFHCSCGRIWEHVCDEAEGCFYTEVTDERRTDEGRAGADTAGGAGAAAGGDDLRGASHGADG